MIGSCSGWERGGGRKRDVCFVLFVLFFVFFCIVLWG